jgi:hypothetical protein
MLELILSHDGDNWVAENPDLTVKAPTLEKLDTELTAMVKDKGYIKEGGKLKIFMAFDNATIPQWIRQYSQHYFNRVIEVEF